MIKTGFAQEVITPERGLGLAGYFTPRPNRGVLDDIYVKALIFQQGKTTCGIVTYDMCGATKTFYGAIKKHLRAQGFDFADSLLFAATHSHTAPSTMDFFAVSGNKKDYYRELVRKSVAAITRAYKNLAESTLRYGAVNKNPYAFNRRYFMRNGLVVTNPGKLNPDIVKPEGTVDREIGIVRVEQEGQTVALLVNIVNHTDTIGGDLVSADWPGRMEKTIQAHFGYDVAVMTVIGCAGNINHFDVKSARGQTNYDEAKKIGGGYAKIVCGQLDSLKRTEDYSLRVSRKTMTIPYRAVSDEDIREARAILKKKVVQRDGNLTSEDLAKGDEAVARFFAERLIRFKKNCSGKSRRFDMLAIKIGNQLAIASLPGEPFTEIGMEIKKRSPFSATLLVSHGMGECGYIPLKECFGRGGYETLPVEVGGVREDTAERLVTFCTDLL